MMRAGDFFVSTDVVRAMNEVMTEVNCEPPAVCLLSASASHTEFVSSNRMRAMDELAPNYWCEPRSSDAKLFMRAAERCHRGQNASRGPCGSNLECES